jgi:hypothetical protein
MKMDLLEVRSQTMKKSILMMEMLLVTKLLIRLPSSPQEQHTPVTQEKSYGRNPTDEKNPRLSPTRRPGECWQRYRLAKAEWATTGKLRSTDSGQNPDTERSRKRLHISRRPI